MMCFVVFIANISNCKLHHAGPWEHDHHNIIRDHGNTEWTHQSKYAQRVEKINHQSITTYQIYWFLALLCAQHPWNREDLEEVHQWLQVQKNWWSKASLMFLVQHAHSHHGQRELHDVEFLVAMPKIDSNFYAVLGISKDKQMSWDHSESEEIVTKCISSPQEFHGITLPTSLCLQTKRYQKCPLNHMESSTASCRTQTSMTFERSIVLHEERS